jgi:hypothetical protein
MPEEFYYAMGIKQPIKEVSFWGEVEEKNYIDGLKKNRERYELEGWIPLEKELIEKFYLDEGFNYYLYTPGKPDLQDWVKLSYRTNSHGFRMDEEMPTTTKRRSIITLGCSNTFGIGMPNGQIWPTLVGHSLRQRAYNLGYPAGSLDKAFRLLLAWLPVIRPSHVFLLEPPGVRYESISGSLGYSNHLTHNITGIPLRFEKEEEWILHREKTLRAIHSVCDQFDTPLTTMQIDDNHAAEVTKLFGRTDSARDLTHPGRFCHIRIAMTMLKKAGFEWDITKNS